MQAYTYIVDESTMIYEPTMYVVHSNLHGLIQKSALAEVEGVRVPI